MIIKTIILIYTTIATMINLHGIIHIPWIIALGPFWVFIAGPIVFRYLILALNKK